MRLILSIILLFCTYAVGLAQVEPETVIPPDTVVPPPVCEVPEPATISLQAQTWDLVGSTYRARGNVLFQKGPMQIRARSLWYNSETMVGQAENVVFTTCEFPKPDYRVEAQEITFYPKRKVHLRRPSLYIGNFKVLSLPWVKFRVGGNQSTNSVFPRPGFDDEDGFTISQDLRLIDDDDVQLEADLRLTTSGGIQGQLWSVYGFDGDLSRFPGRYLTYDSLRETVIDLPKRPAGAPCPPEELSPENAARLRAFGVFSLRQRTYDIEDEGLVVYRQPEIGLHYIGRQINLTNTRLDPRLHLYPEIVGTWGNYRESPGDSSYIMRSSIGAVVPFNVIPLGPRTSIQPVIQQNYSWYDNGDTYHTWAYAVDASHLFPNDSVVDIRYIKRNESGVTPFQFDNIDIMQEIQGGFQVYMKRHTLGFVASYDLDDRSLYEWEIMYGYRTDCLATWFRWNDRLNKFSMDVMLVNL